MQVQKKTNDPIGMPQIPLLLYTLLPYARSDLFNDSNHERNLQKCYQRTETNAKQTVRFNWRQTFFFFIYLVYFIFYFVIWLEQFLLRLFYSFPLYIFNTFFTSCITFQRSTHFDRLLTCFNIFMLIQKIQKTYSLENDLGEVETS